MRVCIGLNEMKLTCIGGCVMPVCKHLERKMRHQKHKMWCAKEMTAFACHVMHMDVDKLFGKVPISTIGKKLGNRET